MHYVYCVVRDFKNEACLTANIISDIMKQEEMVNQAKRVWIVDITFRGRSENILTWRRVIQRCISWWYFRYFSSLWYQVGQCYLLRNIHMWHRVIFLHFGLTTCKQIRLQLSPIEIALILDKIKCNSKPPSPQIKDEAARRAKTHHFPILDLGGGRGV